MVHTLCVNSQSDAVAKNTNLILECKNTVVRWEAMGVTTVVLGTGLASAGILSLVLH